MAALSVGYVAWHGHHAVAFAKGGDDGDDNGDDSDDSGGDDKGGDDKGGDDDSDDANDEDAKNQPPVTAGGLFTLKTYPTNENSRPLTITQGIAQAKLSLGTDLSAKGAFKTFGVSLEGEYGVRDNFMILGGLTDAYNFRQFGIYAGIEGSLIYDLLDFRVALNAHRNALAEYQNYCTPVATGDPENPTDASTCKAGSMASIVNLPNGTYHRGDMKYSIDIGFPFRYAFKPQIAIVALQTLMTIDFNGVDKDHLIFSPETVTDAMGNSVMINQAASAPNKATPDFAPSLGVAINPIPQIQVVLQGQLRIPDFDTSAGQYQVPLTGRVEVSPNNRIDFGLEFTLLNVLPPDGQSAFDNRYLALFIQARAGK